MLMIKACSVIYFPGTSGNLLIFCLSLSKETVPYYHTNLNSCTNDELLEISELSASQRKHIIAFDNATDFIKHHSPEKNLVEPGFFYKNTVINDRYQWAILKNHPNTYQTRLPWLHQILYLKLDFEKNGYWLKNVWEHYKTQNLPPQRFGLAKLISNNYQLPDIQLAQQQEIINQKITKVISIDNIIQSQEGFINEYQNCCNILNITPEFDQVLPFYQNWRKIRVDPYI